MKNILRHLILIGFGVGLTPKSGHAYPGLHEVHNFGKNPGNLAMFRYIPKNAQDEKAAPLVIVLHGCNQSAGAIARCSDWCKLGDQYGFYLLFPEQKIINNPSRCFNWFIDKDIAGNEGEVFSIHQMTNYMFSHHNIDSNKVFIYGVSAGAVMSVAFMVNYPEYISSGAILAGSSYGMANNAIDGVSFMRKPKNYSSEEWKRRVREVRPDYHGTYPRLVVLHGQKDPVVHPHHSDELVKQWKALHSIDSDPILRDTFNGNEKIVKLSWVKDSSTIISYYKVRGMGHALPVNPDDTGVNAGGKAGAFARDVDFFSTYWIAKDFELISPSKH